MSISNSELKFKYKVKDKIGLVTLSKFTPIVLVISYIILTVVQMIRFALGHTDLVDITINDHDSWKVWLTYSTSLIGTFMMIFAATKQSQGRKDFYIYRIIALILFIINNAIIKLWMSFVKLSIIIVITLYQHFNWAKQEGDVMSSQSLPRIQVIAILIMIFFGGFIFGFVQTLFVTNKDKWISYLDAATFFAAISSVTLLARMKKEGFTLGIMNAIMILFMVWGIGVWSTILATAFNIATGIYGYLNWEYNYYLNNDPQHIYKVTK